MSSETSIEMPKFLCKKERTGQSDIQFALPGGHEWDELS